MDKLIRFFSLLDWFMGVASVIVGLYMGNGWVIAAGVLGLIVAYFKPAVRIKNALEKKFLHKRVKQQDSDVALAEDQFYSAILATPANVEDALAEAVAVKPRTYADAPVPYGRLFISANKHNRLRPEAIGVSTNTKASHYH